MSAQRDDFGFRPRRDLEAKENDFGFIPRFESRKEEKEPSSLLENLSQQSENINRQLLRVGARGAETALGAPRAFGEFLESIVPEKAIKAGAEKIGLKEPVEKGFELAKKFAPYKLFPTSEQVRENVTKKLFGEHLEPKNEWEQKADELVSDFTALALPLPGSQLKVLKPAILALGGNIASDVVGRVGGSEKEKTYAKLGTILTGSLINPKAAETLKNDLYAKARENRPPNVRVVSPNLDRNLNQVERQLKKGGSEPWKDKIFNKIKEIREQVAGNTIEVEELEKFKTSINNIITDLYAEQKTGRPGIKSARRFTNKLGKVVDKSLQDYGKQNPQWEAFYRPANEVHGAIAESHKVRNIIGRVAKKYGHHAILPLLGIGHVTSAVSTLGGTLAAGAIGAGAVTGGEIVAKFTKSPTLRKHYMNLINSALKEDAIAVEQNLKKLEKELEENE